MATDGGCKYGSGRLRAELAAAGTDIGAHDRLVAATAVATGWRVGTSNLRHFTPVQGLDVIEIRLGARE